MSDFMTCVGLDAAKAYLRKPFRLTVEDGYPEYPLEEATNKPHLYRRTAIRGRLLPVLAALPVEFFRVVTAERRVSFHATPYTAGLSMAPPDQIVWEHGSRASAIRPLEEWRDGPIIGWGITLGRIAVELYEAAAFSGVVAHELCHVYLGHDVQLWQLSDKEWQCVEDEAVACACQFGFRPETEAWLAANRDLWGDTVETGRLPE